jgi:hypothetical protein
MSSPVIGDEAITPLGAKALRGAPSREAKRACRLSQFAIQLIGLPSVRSGLCIQDDICTIICSSLIHFLSNTHSQLGEKLFKLGTRRGEREPVHWSERANAWHFTRYNDVFELQDRPDLSIDRIEAVYSYLPRVNPERFSDITIAGFFTVMTRITIALRRCFSKR